MTAAPILYYRDKLQYRANKALVAAKINGIDVQKKPFPGGDDKVAEVNPVGKLPYLHTDMGPIFSSNAIAKYIGNCREDTGLCGNTFMDSCQVDSWMEFCLHELEVPLCTWVFPMLGLLSADADTLKQAAAAGKEDTRLCLQRLEAHLKDREFLVGNAVTLADVVLVCALTEGYKLAFDPAFRKPFPNVNAWFQKCAAMPAFKSILGEVKMADKEAPIKEAALKKEAKPGGGGGTPAPAKGPAAPPPAAAAPAAGGADAIAALGNEIRELKAKLKAEGMSGKQVDKDERVVEMVARLQQLKSGGGGGSPKAAPAKGPAAAPAAPPAPAAGGDTEAQIKEVGDQIRDLKAKLKGEGMSGGAINKDPKVAELVAKLQQLKAGGGGGGGGGGSPKAAQSKSPAAAPAPPPAPAAGGDTEAQIKEVGDQIRDLKAKLKGEGMSGGAINKDPKVAELVAKLQQLKAGGGGGGSPKAAAAKSPKAAPAPAPAAGGDKEAQIKEVGDQIRELKAKLKGEGMSGNAINKDPRVAEMVAKLQALKA